MFKRISSLVRRGVDVQKGFTSVALRGLVYFACIPFGLSHLTEINANMMETHVNVKHNLVGNIARRCDRGS